MVKEEKKEKFICHEQ